MKYKPLNAIASGLLAILVTASPCTMAQEATSLTESITAGTASLSLRYRLEGVDQDGFTDNALASTLRTRLGFQSSTFNGFDFLLELDDLSYLGDDDFNNTRNNKASYPVVADPDGTDINQLFARFSGEKVTATFGRQRINHDGQRFIGGVGWRQNEQTYDALSLSHQRGLLAATYTYINRVARIFGPDDGSPAATLDSDSHALNLAYQIPDMGTLSGYGYFLDFDNAASASTRTVGLRYSNTFKPGDLAMPVTLEFAHQQDFGSNPANYSVNYHLVEIGLKFEPFTIMIGNELLQGSVTTAFITPLATLHKYQGWADQFLNTPTNGIDDTYLTVTNSFVGIGTTLTYHKFKSDVGSMDYGDEIDLSFAYKLNENLDVLLKFARYNADRFSSDTTKAWLMLTAAF